MTTTMERGSVLGAAFSAELAAVAQRVTGAVTEVRAPGHGNGAGTVWSTDGTVITNHHVVPDDRAEVVLADGRAFAARVRARDPENDLVALTLQGVVTGLTAAAIGDARILRAGDLVLAVGHPFGVRQSLTAGIVITALPARPEGRELLRAAVLLGPGNSGGPLTDAQGRVVGINAMVAGGLALAVPSHLVSAMLGVRDRPRTLGIEGREVELPAVYAAAAGGLRAAILVIGVQDGSTAAGVGLQAGDLLLAANDRPAGTVEGLRAQLARTARPLELAILRGGVRLNLVIDLAVAPAAIAA